MNDNILSRIADLRLELLRHRYRYYVLCDPIISDPAYDNLERRLKNFVESYPAEANAAKFVEFCPTAHPGSEFADSYPKEVREHFAEHC